ncbi:DgyrCDS6544 [Dimorphilus gyrociliatus]|uniref:DgyrCDS6544 n=1 Tax=Dimorphilus gyrociliatus TaxID=2664684 RepID=A0A7I8VNC6_9ANNE|nr:DgyrCDS6544 [Dimorphilus gyrociliatus]
MSKSVTALNDEDARIYKMVVIGDGAVGKSALTIQFFQRMFVEEYDPTIEDMYVKHAVVDGENCVLDVLDTAGQEEYSAMREQYMSQGDGYLLVYSVTDERSFRAIKRFHSQALRVKDTDSFPMILVANKIDLNSFRKVSIEDGVELANKFSIPYIETSAKNPPINVEEAFYSLFEVRNENEKTYSTMASPSSRRADKSGIAADIQRKLTEKYDVAAAQKVLDWMQELIGNNNSFPEAADSSCIGKAFNDGTILVTLANAIQENAIPAKYAKPSTMAFKKMEAINMFIQFCRNYGVPDHELFETVDLYEEQNMVQVMTCLESLARKAKSKGGPGFGPKEATKNQRNFSQEVLDQSKSALPLNSSGTNKGASQSGMSFGNRRHVTNDGKF